jgi:hypothetical protein
MLLLRHARRKIGETFFTHHTSCCCLLNTGVSCVFSPASEAVKNTRGDPLWPSVVQRVRIKREPQLAWRSHATVLTTTTKYEEGLCATSFFCACSFRR